MNKLRAEEIKKELNYCEGDCGLSTETIKDLVNLLERLYPNKGANVSKDTTPMIGNNPFRKDSHSSDSDNAPAKDFNQSLNYRVKRFGEDE